MSYAVKQPSPLPTTLPAAAPRSTLLVVEVGAAHPEAKKRTASNSKPNVVERDAIKLFVLRGWRCAIIAGRLRRRQRRRPRQRDARSRLGSAWSPESEAHAFHT